MNDDRNRLLAKLRALRAKTVDAGCTEAEAMAAAGKVEELLRQYAISRDELDQRGFTEAPYTAHTFSLDARFRHDAVTRTCAAIATLCECEVWMAGRKAVRFFGEEQDVEMAVYLAGVIEKAIEAEWFIYSFANPAAPMRDFTLGCARRIHERLAELRSYQETAVRSAGKGLVVQTKAMVRARKMSEARIVLGKAKKRATRVGDREAYFSGYAAGNNVTFQQGVRGNGSPAAAKVALTSR
jgi:hypothetical protein